MNVLKAILVDRNLDYSDFCKKLSSADATNKITIDCGTDHLKHYAIIELNGLIIGIRHEIGGRYPIIKHSMNETDLHIGVDNKLISISLNEKKICWSGNFDTPFVDMHIFADSQSIIVIEECGVSRWRYNGNRDWFCSTDFIQNYLIDSDLIIISQADLEKIKISTHTGKIIK